MQRIFDVILSFSAILVLSPLLTIVALILKMTGENEIFYKQIRIGRSGNSFGVLKFATMLKDSPNIGAGEITVKDDPRVLPIGKFLRKSKINELPQLWNIFIGDMSIVGPRPMVPNTFLKYPQSSRSIINSVRPGLTGIGSIVFRDEEKLLENRKNEREFYDNCIIPYKSSLEIWYVKNATLSLYFKCILITVWVVFFPKSEIHLRAFKDLPLIPEILKN